MSDGSSCFFSPNEERSFVLIVEGQKLFVSKETLAIYSPVFKKMFYGNFKESEENFVKLPEKKLPDVVELLECLLPYPSKSEITHENVNLMLQFADEYDICDLRNRCEKYLLHAADKFNSTNESEILTMLHLASKFRLNSLLKICIKQTASLPSNVFKEQRANFPVAVAAAVFEAKLHRFEALSHELSRKDPFFCSCRYCGATPSTRCVRCKQGVCAECITKEKCSGFHIAGCPIKFDSVPLAVLVGHDGREYLQREQDCLCGYDFDESSFN